MAKDIIAVVLVGGRGVRLGAITKHTAKPAVSFGGKYRLIDFVLSNLSRSPIDTVGIITQYEPHALMHYIQRGSSFDLDVSDGGIHFLTPFTDQDGSHWQEGTAHAIRQHFRFIDDYAPQNVLVLAGDHVYTTDYRPLIVQHLETDADITISAFHPDDDLRRYGILQVDETGRIDGFQEKPEHPAGRLASMGVYVFKTDALKRLLKGKLAAGPDFGRHVIPAALQRGFHVHAYIYQGYFRDVGTPESLHAANMDLLDPANKLVIDDAETAPLFTRSEALPPLLHKKGHVKNSLIADGARIFGDVFHSVISSGVTVEAGASVSNSVVFPHVIVGQGARLDYTIVLEDLHIPAGTVLECSKVTVVDATRLRVEGGKAND